MTSKKQPQEMIQVASPSFDSSFWKNDSTGSGYSHAKIIQVDSLCLSGNSKHGDSRPATPPSIHRTSTSPIRSGSVLSSIRKDSYSSFLSQTNYDWEADEDEDESDFLFDDCDDEDEFGLPSIASIRRKGKRRPVSNGEHSQSSNAYSNDDNLSRNCRRTSIPSKALPGSVTVMKFQNLSAPIFSPLKNTLTSSATTSWHADSGDISEERDIPTYPSTSKYPTGTKILRPQYKEILRDPINSLHLISHTRPTPSTLQREGESHAARISRINNFKQLLQSSFISLAALRKMAWSGIPEEVRSITWQILLGYLPTTSDRRVATLDRKRREYLEGVRQVFSGSDTASGRNEDLSLSAKPARPRILDESIWHQISIDVPRTNPHVPLYSFPSAQRSLERILYLWAIRHPACGYVQGINGLATPFYQVFLAAYITSSEIESGMDPGQLPRAVVEAVEADTYYCLCKLLDGIQDNYISNQPGIVRQVQKLKELVTRIDGKLAAHLALEEIEFMGFSFRWMNCLLMREINSKCTIRMWDTYLSEENGFTSFHVYVCAAMLVKFSGKLLEMEFQEIMMFLQALPTQNWGDKDVELLLSEAFILQSLFDGSRAHLQGMGETNNRHTGGMLGPS